VEAWVNGVRKGHTYFSTGPLIEFRVNGALPGDALHLLAAGGSVVLEGTVVSLSPLSKVVINHKHGVLREIPLDGKSTSARFREEIKLTDSDWFSVMAEGPHNPVLDSKFLLAGTNAVRVYVGDQKLRDRPSAEYFIRWIDVLRKETEEWLWWRSPQEREHILAQYEEARRIYQHLADEAR
jgi:hypothetical protein